MSAETDRGVALVCAAYLGEELKSLLENGFIDAPDVTRRLFDGTGPLATFSSRIDLAFAMGQVSEQSHRALHFIRKIRNDFAHTHRERSFKDQGISDRCRELVSLNPDPRESDPRKLYVRAALSVLAEIHVQRELSKHEEARKPGPVDAMRAFFPKPKNALDTLMVALTEEQMAPLSSPETSMAEKKRRILETLRRAGVRP